MTRSRDDVLGTLEANRDAILSFGVRRIGLFGSMARGEATESSDLDFVVEFEHKSFDTYMGLKEFLEDLFGCSVDLVIPDAIKPRLRAAILSEAVHARDYKVFLEDMRDAIAKIHRYTAGLRNILIHQYFAFDVEIIWDVVQNKLPELGKEIEHMLGE